jgi:hypothetical protein
MKQRSFLRVSGMAAVALLTLLSFSSNIFAQCAPRNSRVQVYQQQRYYNNYPAQYSNYPTQYYGSQPYYEYEQDRRPSRSKNMVVGGVIGAIGGALLGGKTGAAVGAGAGAGVGYMIYKNQKRKYEQRNYGYYPYYR